MYYWSKELAAFLSLFSSIDSVAVENVDLRVKSKQTIHIDSLEE